MRPPSDFGGLCIWVFTRLGMTGKAFMAEQIIRVGLAGFGTVGTGVAKLIVEDADSIATRTGLRLELACVVDIDKESASGGASRRYPYR